MKNTWISADSHGEYKKLKQAFDNTPTKEGDTLIFLGDYIDRGEDCYGVIEYLCSLSLIYKCIFLKGNHDEEFIYGLDNGFYPLYSQGAKETLESYLDNCFPDGLLHERSNLTWEHLPIAHYKFFKNLLPYYVDEDNNLFVHGGINRHKLLSEQDEVIFLWDRDMLGSARSYSSMKDNTYPFKFKEKFKEVFVGHTPTYYLEGYHIPLHYANIWGLDLGAGKFKDGKICFMNLETKEYYTNE